MNSPKIKIELVQDICEVIQNQATDQMPDANASVLALSQHYLLNDTLIYIKSKILYKKKGNLKIKLPYYKAVALFSYLSLFAVNEDDIYYSSLLRDTCNNLHKQLING